jgi:cell division protein FtsL
MKSNRYRNSIGLPVITAVLILCAAVLLAALSVVVNKNRVSALAEQQRQVEQEMRLLNIEITNLERKIDQMLDGAKVQPILQAKGTWLQKLNPQTRSIIYLKPIPAAKAVAQTDSVPAGTAPTP